MAEIFGPDLLIVLFVVVVLCGALGALLFAMLHTARGASSRSRRMEIVGSATSTKACTKCGVRIPSDSRFCKTCGSPQETI
jgi:hypothetical protein